MKKIILILVFLAAIVGSIYYFTAHHRPTAAAVAMIPFDPHAPVVVATTEPIVRRVEHSIETVGTFLAEDTVEVSPNVSGPVAEILVDEGALVKKGDVLMRLDVTRFQYEYDRARADVTRSEAEAISQRANLERQTRLSKTNAIARAELEQAIATAGIAEAQLMAARSALSLEEKNLKDVEVRSPLDGTVSARMISEGEYAKVGTSAYQIVSTTPLKLRFTLPERYAGEIRVGQKIELTVRATGERKFAGEIYLINPTVNPEALTLEVKALVDNKDGALRPGYFAQVRLITDVNERAILIPQEALVIRDSGQVAYVANGDTAQVRNLTLGVKEDELVEVLAGIQPNDAVITSGQFQLSDGKAISARP